MGSRMARAGFIWGMSLPDDLDRLSLAGLKGLVVQQLEQIVEPQRMLAAPRDEIARLKGGPGRPQIKQRGMERETGCPRFRIFRGAGSTLASGAPR